MKKILEKEAEKFLAEMKRNGLSYKVKAPEDGLRVVITGGDAKTRKLYQDRLRGFEDKTVEAILVYEYANERTDGSTGEPVYPYKNLKRPDLMYLLEERAAIREFDANLTGDIYEAIKSYFKCDDDLRERKNQKEQQNINLADLEL